MEVGEDDESGEGVGVTVGFGFEVGGLEGGVGEEVEGGEGGVPVAFPTVISG